MHDFRKTLNHRNTQYKITRELSQIPGAFLDLLIAVASLEALKAVHSLHHRLRGDALSCQNKSVRTQTKIDGARAKRVLEQHAAPVPSSFPRFSSTHARSAAPSRLDSPSHTAIIRSHADGIAQQDITNAGTRPGARLN